MGSKVCTALWASKGTATSAWFFLGREKAKLQCHESGAHFELLIRYKQLNSNLLKGTRETDMCLVPIPPNLFFCESLGIMHKRILQISLGRAWGGSTSPTSRKSDTFADGVIVLLGKSESLNVKSKRASLQVKRVIVIKVALHIFLGKSLIIPLLVRFSAFDRFITFRTVPFSMIVYIAPASGAAFPNKRVITSEHLIFVQIMFASSFPLRNNIMFNIFAHRFAVFLFTQRRF